MKFRLIPPGECMMGSTPAEIAAALPIAGDDLLWQDCIKSEGPRHKVILTQPTYLCVTEVTQSQYTQVMGKNPSYYAASGKWSEYVTGIDTSTFPVEGVTWDDATEFCGRLIATERLESGGDTNRTFSSPFGDAAYRLPSEVEWEFACRAGTESQYYTGNTSKDLSRAGWCVDTSNKKTHAVGELQQNSFGLYDMHGNVWEWTLDTWSPAWYSTLTSSLVVNPFNRPVSGAERMTRGGNYSSNAYSCRSASRCSEASAYSATLIGFRVALSVDGVRQALKMTAHAMPKSGSSNSAAAAKASEKPPATFTNSLGMEFVKVPKGTGWLGGGGGKPGEQKVEFTDDFYLGKYEVTQEEWEKVTGLNPSHFSRNGDGKDAVKDIADADLKRFPVESVSWDDCQFFVERLNTRFGETEWVYRLPTGAEWEYACRCGPLSDRIDSGFDFYFENPSLMLEKNQANFDFEKPDLMLRKDQADIDHPLKRTCRVGSYKPNSLGLFDLHGNVWEWTLDEDTHDPEKGSQRMYRGGSWEYGAEVLRSANRFGMFPPTWSINHLGLRLARVRRSPSQPLSSETEAPIDFAAERKAAEWVLNVGGTAVAKTPSGRDFSLNSFPLPDQPFWLTLVSCSFNDRVTDEGVKNLAGCRRIDELYLGGCRNLTDAGIRQLSPQMSIKALSIPKNDLGDAALEWVAQFHSIAALEIQEQNWTDRGIAAVARLPNLRQLSISNSPQLTDATLEQLTPATKLQHVGIANSNSVTAKGLERFLLSHAEISELQIACDKAEWLSAVHDHPRLERLHISASQLMASAETLNTLPQLHTLSIGFGISDAVLRRLASIPRIRVLDIRDYHETATSTAAGWSELRRMPELERLIIARRIPMTDEVLENLTEIASLKRLEVDLDPAVSCPTADGIEAFRKARPDVHLQLGGKDYPAKK